MGFAADLERHPAGYIELIDVLLQIAWRLGRTLRQEVFFPPWLNCLK
jgi:hypothetical protein